MEKAEMKVGENWEKVYAKDISEKDRYAEFRCCECHRTAHPSIPKSKKRHYFFSREHTNKCSLAKGEKKISKNEVDDLEYVLEYKDKVDGNKRKTEEPPTVIDIITPKEDDEDVVDYTTIEGEKKLRSCSSFFKSLRKRKLDDPFGKAKVCDTIIDSRTIEAVRDKKLSGVKLIIGKKCFPPFDVPKEYIVVRDPYTDDKKNKEALYYLLKCETHESDVDFRNEFFKVKSVVDGKIQYEHKYIAAFGVLEDAAIPGYKVYKMQPLAKIRYCFPSEKEVKSNG